MRSISSDQQGVLSAGNQAEFVRVSVKDAGGTFRDLTTYPGYNSVRSVNWGERIEDPHQTFDVTLMREHYALSLSPFVSGSAVNRAFDPTNAFSALLALNRELKIEVAVVPMGLQPASGDWMEVLRGRIDTIDVGQSMDVRIGGRGLSGRLAQQYIKTERVYSYAVDGGHSVALRVWEPQMAVTTSPATYVLPATRGDNGAGVQDSGFNKFLKCSQAGSTGTDEPTWTTGAGQTDGTAKWDYVGAPSVAGNPVEQVMQNILDDNKASADPTVTLFTPVSPSWAILQFIQQRTFVLDAIRTLAQQIGWDIRYKWRSGTSQFEMTFYEPVRSSPGIDFTFAPADYAQPTQLAIDIAEIRNSWLLWYSDAADLWPDGQAKRKSVTAVDSTSITKYGELWAEIQEDSASQIDSSTEAQRLVDSALSDCKEPTAVLAVPLMRGFPWVELNDFYEFSADAIHFDSDQSLAVTQYAHAFDGGDAAHMKTTLTLRGLPTIGALVWLGSTVHPDIPLKNQGAHQVMGFSGTDTPLQIMSSAVGGAQAFLQQRLDRNQLRPEYEVHVYPISGTTLGPATLSTVTQSISNAYIDGLVPGKRYYSRTIPRWHNGDRLIRGQPSIEQSFVAGRAGAGHLEQAPDYSRKPTNGGFETWSEAVTAPPDHWTMQVGTWGSGSDWYGTATATNGYQGSAYLLGKASASGELRSGLFAVEDGINYQVTWATRKASGTNGNLQLILRSYDGAQAFVQEDIVDTANAGNTGAGWNLRGGQLQFGGTAIRYWQVVLRLDTNASSPIQLNVAAISVYKNGEKCGEATVQSDTTGHTVASTTFATLYSIAAQTTQPREHQLVLFGCSLHTTVAGDVAEFRLTTTYSDGSTNAGTPKRVKLDQANVHVPVTLAWAVPGDPAQSGTSPLYTVEWRRLSGTGTLTTNTDDSLWIVQR